MDNFQEINDRFGHKAGNNVLRSVSKNITWNIRKTDMSGRYGGDKFMVILPGIGVNYAKEITERLLEDIRRISLEDFHITFSCGIVELFDEKADHLVEKADKALYNC